jgi:hypothetical protein
MGAGIGIACALEQEVRAWLRLAESSLCTNEEMMRSAWSSALRRVLDAIESYHLAVDLGESISVALETMVFQYMSCHESVLEGDQALDNAGFWIPKRLEEVDYYVGLASELLHANLKAKDGRAAALFRLVALAAVCATDDETAEMLTEFARASGLKKELWSQLVEATRAKSGFEILQREFNRLNKTVERELSYGTAFESA